MLSIRFGFRALEGPIRAKDRSWRQGALANLTQGLVGYWDVGFEGVARSSFGSVFAGLGERPIRLGPGEGLFTCQRAPV